METKNENLNSNNEEQELEDAELDEISDDEQDPDVLRGIARKATEIAKANAEKNKQLFARTKKAEGFVLKDGKWVKPESKPEKKVDAEPAPQPQNSTSGNLTTRDTMALIKANVHDEDIEEIVEYAAFKKISIAEALNSNVIKTSIAEKAELRNTAAATNTGGGRPASAAPSGDKLLEKASSTGELPESDEGIDALVSARLKSKKKK